MKRIPFFSLFIIKIFIITVIIYTENALRNVYKYPELRTAQQTFRVKKYFLYKRENLKAALLEK